MSATSRRKAPKPPPMAHCHCANCDVRVGTYENQWTRLTASYIASKSKGTHRFLEFAKEKRKVQPGVERRAVEGCLLQEAVCGNCRKVVGAFCAEIGSPSQDHLADKMFFKSAKIYLRDRYTNRQVDPMFDVQDLSNTYSDLLAQPTRDVWKDPGAQQPTLKIEDGDGVLPSVENGAAGREETSQELPFSENTLILRRLATQGRDIQRASAAIAKLEKEMREVKKLLAVSSGDPAADFTKSVALMTTTLKQLNPKKGEVARLRAENEALKRRLDEQFQRPQESIGRGDAFGSAHVPNNPITSQVPSQHDPYPASDLSAQMRETRLAMFGEDDFVEYNEDPPINAKPDFWDEREHEIIRILRDEGKPFSEIALYFPNRTVNAVRKHWYSDMQQVRPQNSTLTPKDVEELRVSLGLDPQAGQKKRRGRGRPRKSGPFNFLPVVDADAGTVNGMPVSEAQLEEERQFQAQAETQIEGQPGVNGHSDLNGVASNPLSPARSTSADLLQAEIPIDPLLLNDGPSPVPTLAADTTDPVEASFANDLLEAARLESEQPRLQTAEDHAQPNTVATESTVQSEYPPLISPEKPRGMASNFEELHGKPSSTAGRRSTLRSRTPASSLSRPPSRSGASNGTTPTSGARKPSTSATASNGRKAARTSGVGATATAAAANNADHSRTNQIDDADDAAAAATAGEETEEDREKKRREKIAARDLLVKRTMEREESLAAV